MKSFQKERGFKHILYSKPILIFLGFLVLFFAWNVFGFWNKMRGTKENERLAENKVLELQKEKDKLTSDINKLKTPEGVEAAIREKFGLAKEGEGMIVVVDDKSTTVPVDTKPKGFFSYIKSWFK